VISVSVSQWNGQRIMPANPNQNQHAAVTCPAPKQSGQRLPAGVVLDPALYKNKPKK
jgi:hypothetical protein